MYLGIINITFNRTATHFMDDRFVNLGEEVILTLLWQSGASESEFCALCVCVCVCALACVREGDSHTTMACVQTHTSFITVSVTWLCSPLRLELMVKLRTLLNVFTYILKDKACDYRKGRLHFSDSCLYFSANHNALGQLANQSRLCFLEGGTL